MTDTVEALLSNYTEDVATIARRLREIVREALPDANEIVTGHKNISYHTKAGVMKGGLAYVAPLKDSVNLGLMDGVDLPDPDGLLKGTGKRLRHVKFTSLDEVNTVEPGIRALLAAQLALHAD